MPIPDACNVDEQVCCTNWFDVAATILQTVGDSLHECLADSCPAMAEFVSFGAPPMFDGDYLTVWLESQLPTSTRPLLWTATWKVRAIFSGMPTIGRGLNNKIITPGVDDYAGAAKFLLGVGEKFSAGLAALPANIGPCSKLSVVQLLPAVSGDGDAYAMGAGWVATLTSKMNG